ncbi:MAG: hypothetical protein ACXWJU_05530 [Hyphomicrobium sp.]
MSQPRSARRSGANAAAHFKPELVVAPFGYERARDLPKLLPLWELELATPSEAEHARLLARLRRALRAERLRGLSGHWTYDLARHAQLLRAYRAEVAACLRVRASQAPAHCR